jgi:hypothetical protein
VDESGTDEAPDLSNPIIAYLVNMTPEDEAALAYLRDRDREAASEPDPDALPSAPPAK